VDGVAQVVLGLGDQRLVAPVAAVDAKPGERWLALGPEIQLMTVGGDTRNCLTLGTWATTSSSSPTPASSPACVTGLVC
jgi:hypothetical protein